MCKLLFNLHLAQLFLLLLLFDLLLGSSTLGAGLHQVEGGALGCADSFALVVYAGYLWFHLNVELLLLSNFLMAGVNQSVHPCTKRLPNESVDYVYHVLPREIQPFMLNQWECFHDLRVWLCKLVECLNLQTLILWYIEVLDFFPLDPAPFPRHEVTHMPHGHGIIGAEVCANLMCEEVIDLLLVPHLRSKVLGVHLHLLVACGVDVFFLFHLEL